MHQKHLDRLHAPALERLSASGDWQGLCLHFATHGHVRALDLAGPLLEQGGLAGGARGWLPALLGPLRPYPRCGPFEASEAGLERFPENRRALALLLCIM